MNDIIKLIPALEDFNILLKGVTKLIKTETKEQKGGFLSMLWGSLGAKLLGNLLTGKGLFGAGSGNKKGKGILRAGFGNKKGKGIVRAGSGKYVLNTRKQFNNVWLLLHRIYWFYVSR